MDPGDHGRLRTTQGAADPALMVTTILISLLAGFFAWLFLDMIVEALFPRTMDPSVTQRAKPPLATKVVHGVLVSVGIAVTIAILVVRLLRDT